MFHIRKRIADLESRVASLEARLKAADFDLEVKVLDALEGRLKEQDDAIDCLRERTSVLVGIKRVLDAFHYGKL